MGKLLVILGFVGCAWTVAMGLLAPSRQANEKAGVLQADRVAATLEPAPPGSIASTQFILRNRGDAPLKLGKPTATCGCVETTLSSDLIPPGGKTELRVSIRVPENGKRRETVTVVSDSRVSKVMTVAVTAVVDVSPPYVVREPAPVLFNGWLESGAERYVGISTVELDDQEPWLHAFETDLPFVTADLAEIVTQPGESGVVRRRYRVRLRLATLPEAGKTQGTLRAFPSQPSENTTTDSQIAEVPLIIDPAPPIEANPSSLYLTGATDEKGLIVHLRATQRDFVLSAIPNEPLPEWISIEPADSPLDSMQSFRVRIAEPTADESPDSSVARSEVHFVTNHPGMPELSIPVIVRTINFAGR